MPYIDKTRRKLYDEYVDELVYLLSELYGLDELEIKGHLNYVVSSIMAKLVKMLPRKYHYITLVKDALADAIDEYKRRVVGPYEDEKIKENGDIY